MHLSSTAKLSQFATDVLEGLSSAPKFLSSKYFYDNEGTRLFREIMDLPEYYLTNCEIEIFRTQTDQICRRFATSNDPFELIELGAGDGTKTAILIDQLIRQNADVSYSTIDISAEALDVLADRFRAEFPTLKIETRSGDYFKILESLKGRGRRKVILFLGSNIGNLPHDRSIAFFQQLHAAMDRNDKLFIGFDLQKDPHVIVRAYDDRAGVTARFNLNLLTRINRELGGDFDIDSFIHYANYRPIDGSARSYLISRRRQEVNIDALGRRFEFDQWEPIFMEISQKYTVKTIEILAEESGFQIEKTFFDSRNYYCNSLWRPI